jgi:hypothetical protein
MKISLFLILMLLSVIAFSQNLSTEDLDQLKSGFKKDVYTKAMQNALSSTDITQLAWNRENVGTTDQMFTYRLMFQELLTRRNQVDAGYFLL